MMSEEELVEKYAEILQTVYDDQDAGAYTFSGILYRFLRELELSKPTVVKPDQYMLPGHGPGVR